MYKITTTYDSDEQDIAYWFVSGPYLKTYPQGDTKANAAIIYKSNPALNDSWSNVDPSDKTVTYYKVTNTDTTIVTSAGTFTNCKKINVTFSYAFNTQYEYWNEANGLVYQSGFLAFDLKDKNFRRANTKLGYVRW